MTSSIESGELVTVRVDRKCLEALVRQLQHEHFAYHDEGLAALRALDALETGLRDTKRQAC